MRGKRPRSTRAMRGRSRAGSGGGEDGGPASTAAGGAPVPVGATATGRGAGVGAPQAARRARTKVARSDRSAMPRRLREPTVARAGKQGDRAGEAFSTWRVNRFSFAHPFSIDQARL